MDQSTLDRLTNQLASSDPAARRQAIIALGRSGDLAALRPLADAYRTDPDPALRELARKAGLHLRENAVPDPQPAEPDLPQSQPSAPPAAEPVEPRPVVVSNEARKSARLLTDEAMTLNMQGNNARAVKSLARAIELNPTLADDGYFMGVAGSVLGVDPAEAVSVLRDRTQRTTYVREAKQQQRQRVIETHMQEAQKFSWSSISLDLLIYMLITGIAPVLLVLVIQQSIESLFGMIQDPEAMAAIDADTRATLEFYQSFNTPVALAALGFGSAFASLLALLLQNVIIHVCAKYLLQGKGTLPYLIYKITTLYNRYLIVVYTVLIIGLWLAIAQAAFFVMICVSIGIILYSLYIFFKIAERIGETYNFGAGVGCVTIIVATLALVLLNSIISVLAAQALGVSISNLLPTSIGPGFSGF